MIFKKIFIFKGAAVAIASLATTAVVVFAWTEPSTTPPGGNVSPPINTGIAGQAKSGGLILNTGGATNGLIVQMGNVGIGKTAPLAKLDVKGELRISNTSGEGGDYDNYPVRILSYYSGNAMKILANSGKEYFGVYNYSNTALGLSGNVGVGITNPSAKLGVGGTGGSGDAVATYANSGNSALYAQQSGSGYAGYFSGKVAMMNGNVGIGTTGPKGKLEINLVNSSGWSGTLEAIRIIPPDANYWMDLRTYIVSAGNVGYSFRTRRWDGSTFDALAVDTNGNVGIGTTNPTAPLDINGQIKIRGGSPEANKVLTSDANGLATWQTPASVVGLPSGASGQTLKNDGNNWVANSNLYNDGTNVGIGTPRPSGKLEVRSDNTTGSDRANQFVISGDTSSAYKLNFGIHTEAAVPYADIGFVQDGVAWRDIVLAKNSGSNVGIGKTAPAEKLDVDGKVKATNYNICYQIQCAGGLDSDFPQKDTGRLNADPATEEGWAWCEPAGDMTRLRIRLYTCD